MNKKIIKTVFPVILFFLAFIFSGCTTALKLYVEEATKTMMVGDEIKLNTNFDDFDTSSTVLWSSSEEEVASVTQDGLVTALSNGTTVITATLDEHTTSITIKVVSNDVEEAVYIEISGLQTVVIDEVIKLSASVYPEEYAQSVVWSSSDVSIATVDNSGSVKGIIPGLVTIKATSTENAKIYKEINVLVRTGSGVQDIIYNYIYNNSYVTTGDIDLSTLNKKVTEMVQEVSPAVLGVTNYEEENGIKSVSTGTATVYKKETVEGGFFYTALTNNHVVENSYELKVYIGDIDEYVVANIVKTDADADLAIITFTHSTYDITPLNFSTDGKLKQGDFVVAIGNPGGYTYYGSVTFGMVSYVDRKLEDSDVLYVQHDVAINPGNSGGPLFNLDGEVVGINTLKLVSSQIEGMGFSVSLKNINKFLN